MALTKLTESLDILQGLADEPALTPSELKIKFDEAANLIKTYINDTLTAELDITTQYLDVTSSIQTQLNAIQSQISAITAKTDEVTATELDRLAGVTSDVQTQLNGKQASISYHTLFTGTWASGSNKTITNFSNYKFFIFKTYWTSVLVYKNDDDNFIYGLGSFFPVGENVYEMYIQGTVSGNTISNAKFYKMWHTSNSSHGTLDATDITAVYGLF